MEEGARAVFSIVNEVCLAGTGTAAECLPPLLRDTAKSRAAAWKDIRKPRAQEARSEPVASGELGCKLRAPSVHYLTTGFLREVESAGFSRDSTIHEVEPEIIRFKGARLVCPRDGNVGCAFVDTLEGSDDAGPATMMLSYTWGYTVGEIVDALAYYCERRGLDPRRTYVWICCLCINQSRVQENLRYGNSVSFDTFSKEF